MILDLGVSLLEIKEPRISTVPIVVI